jgi:pimeloyl-ACP methyl ester carboxylesterase
MRIKKSLQTMAVLAGLSSLCAGSSLAQTQPPQSPPRAPLNLSDMGSFFVGGSAVTSDHLASDYPGVPKRGTVALGQMYVQYLVPEAAKSAPPVIMVHGSRHTGALFETTPDGREGWNTYFVRKGYSTYVVDAPGNGRSNFNVEPINKAVAEKSVADLPTFGASGREHAFVGIRAGKVPGVPHPDTQFPLEVHGQYHLQKVPNTLAAMPGDSWEKGIGALLEKIGPSILMTNSRSGATGWIVGKQHADTLKGIVSIEPQTCNVTDTDLAHFKNVPVFIIFGDHSAGTQWEAPVAACREFVARLQRAGMNAKILVLPDIGIKGNTHVMMMDRNSHDIADRITAWIETLR